MSRDQLNYAQQVCVRATGKIMQETGMIWPGARMGVAVSGGVDSWVLLEVLRRRQAIVPFPFDIMALHVNAGFDPNNHAPLADYLERFGVPGHIELTDHGPRAHSDENRKRSACFYCAMLRRTRLFELCRQYGLTHLAFGHNADDLVVTFFMNMVQNGRIEGMSIKESFFGGELLVVRPMLTVDKSTIVRAAKRWELPVWHNPCPSAGSTRRTFYQEKIKDLHGGDEMLRKNMFHALEKWQLARTSCTNNSLTPPQAAELAMNTGEACCTGFFDGAAGHTD